MIINKQVSTPSRWYILSTICMTSMTCILGITITGKSFYSYMPRILYDKTYDNATRNATQAPDLLPTWLPKFANIYHPELHKLQFLSVQCSGPRITLTCSIFTALHIIAARCSTYATNRLNGPRYFSKVPRAAPNVEMSSDWGREEEAKTWETHGIHKWWWEKKSLEERLIFL